MTPYVADQKKQGGFQWQPCPRKGYVSGFTVVHCAQHNGSFCVRFMEWVQPRVFGEGGQTNSSAVFRFMENFGFVEDQMLCSKFTQTAWLFPTFSEKDWLKCWGFKWVFVNGLFWKVFYFPFWGCWRDSKPILISSMLMSLIRLQLVLLVLSLSSGQYFLVDSLRFVGMTFLRVEGKTRGADLLSPFTSTWVG